MDFKTAINVCLKDKYVQFTGRASLSEFWWFFLFTFIISAILSALTSAFAGIKVMKIIMYIITIIVELVFLLPGLGVAFRRLHDVGKSGWWIFINLIPIVGQIIYIVILARKGEDAENKYGAKPEA